MLTVQDLSIPPRLRLLWTVLLDNRPTHPWRRHIWTSDRYLAAPSDAERRRVEDEVVESISPCLVVRRGAPPGLAFRQYFEKRPRSIRPIDACGHVKLISGNDDSRHQVAPILEEAHVLARHAETLTGYLEQALALGVDDDEVYRDSYLYRPSIAAHDQNRDHDGWTHLIDLVRDSYFTLAASMRRRGANLLRRWVESDQTLFKRLALHSLTENTKSDIQLARKLLLAGRKPGVWELELRREVLRFFRLAGARLPGRLRVEIVRAIHAGPKSTKGKRPPNYAEIIRREKATRLDKLRVSGARLDKKSRALAGEMVADEELGLDERNEFVSWHGKARWIGDEEFAPKELLQGSVDDVVAALENGRIDRDGFRGLVVKQPVKAVSALRRLTKRGTWPANYWQGFLWFLAEPREPRERNARLQDHVARVLVDAPEQLFKGIGSPRRARIGATG